MSEKLLFRIANNRIAELFGTQNFSSKEVALLELVKNAYDAGAKTITISIDESAIVVSDDGIGMTEDTVRNKWMDVGASEKNYGFISKDGEERIYSGSKGIGRFALARLGEAIEMITKADGSPSVIWKTNWDENTIDIANDGTVGTTFRISLLRDKWYERDVSKLNNYISSYKFDDSFDVIIIYNNKTIHCKNIFKEMELGRNALSTIEFAFNAEELSLSIIINNDEFDDKAQIMLDEFNQKEKAERRFICSSIKSFSDVVDVFSELSNEKTSFTKEDLSQLGNFNGVFYFNNDYSKQNALDFLYKLPKTVTSFPSSLSGLFLVRNAFCISGYDGSNDWIGFGKRARKSPAAATHRTGRWRVRENQILGKINIDKKDNFNIRELQNRQGIEDNIYFRLFKQIVEIVLDIFERYRQYIIRIVDEKNKKAVISNDISIEKNVRKFIEKPLSIQSMSDDDVQQLAGDVQILIDSSTAEREAYRKKQEELDYASRVLHSLSTLGLKSASIAHELSTDRNNISGFYGCMVDSLKRYGYWDILSDEEHTKQKAFNVPSMLQGAERINGTIVNYIDTMLNTTKKSRYLVTVLYLKEVLHSICTGWKNDYAWINFFELIDDNLIFESSQDIFETIFGNLILNSVQQNDKKEKLNITIEIKKNNRKLLIIYSDNGVGLTGKYRNKPYDILEPHETSRINGHGLGMWIVYNVITNCGGEVLDINGDDGFKFTFTLMESEYGKN